MLESIFAVKNREISRFDDVFWEFFDEKGRYALLQKCIIENRACLGVAMGACCFLVVLFINRNIKQSNISFFSSVFFNFTILVTACSVAVLKNPVEKGQRSDYLISLLIMIVLIIVQKVIPIAIDRGGIIDPTVKQGKYCESSVNRESDRISDVEILPMHRKKLKHSKSLKPPQPPPSEAAIASFHFAAYQGDLLVLKTFLRQKNIINTQKNGLTALHQAISGLQVAAVNCLVKAGHDVNIASLNKLTPVHVACIEGSLPILKILIENGADIFTHGTDEYSSAHIAIARGHHHILEFLLSKGISLYAKTSRGLSPIDLAKSCKSSTLKSFVKTRISRNAIMIIKELVIILTSKRVPIEIVHQILAFLVDPKSQRDALSQNSSSSIPPIEIDEAEKRTLFMIPVSEIFTYL